MYVDTECPSIVFTKDIVHEVLVYPQVYSHNVIYRYLRFQISVTLCILQNTISLSINNVFNGFIAMSADIKKNLIIPQVIKHLSIVWNLVVSFSKKMPLVSILSTNLNFLFTPKSQSFQLIKFYQFSLNCIFASTVY